MGHTVVPFTFQFQREKIYFAKFRRALLLPGDKLILDDLWHRAEFHIPAAEKASHPLPIATILMMMNLEQEKMIQSLENRVAAQAQQIKGLEKALQDSEAQSAFLAGELKTIEANVEARLCEFRKEMFAVKFPEFIDAA